MNSVIFLRSDFFFANSLRLGKSYTYKVSWRSGTAISRGHVRNSPIVVETMLIYVFFCLGYTFTRRSVLSHLDWYDTCSQLVTPSKILKQTSQCSFQNAVNSLFMPYSFFFLRLLCFSIHPIVLIPPLVRWSEFRGFSYYGPDWIHQAKQKRKKEYSSVKTALTTDLTLIGPLCCVHLLQHIWINFLNNWGLGPW